MSRQSTDLFAPFLAASLFSLVSHHLFMSALLSPFLPFPPPLAPLLALKHPSEGPSSILFVRLFISPRPLISLIFSLWVSLSF